MTNAKVGFSRASVVKDEPKRRVRLLAQSLGLCRRHFSQSFSEMLLP